jgi:LysM repeat protein
MMRKLWVLFAVLATWSAAPAYAGIELAGTTGANFLTQGPGASVFGMGATGIGGYPDLGAMAWNPASLGLLRESQLMLTHMPLPGSSSQDWMAFGGKVGESPTQWALTGRYEGDGSFQAKDPLGNPLGTFNTSSLALGVNASRALDPHISVGMGAKFVNENLGSVSGYGGTFDMGLLLHRRGFGLGFAAQNLGGSIKYDSLAYSMPMNFGVGLSLAHAASGLRLAVDANHPNAYYDDVRFGLEWKIKDVVALRGGYRKELKAPTNDPMNGGTFGIGFGNHGLWLDYGYAASASGKSQQRVTLRVSPKDWGMLFADDETQAKGSQADRTAALVPASVPASASAKAAAVVAPAPTPAPVPASPPAKVVPAPVAAPVAAPAPAAAMPAPAPIETPKPEAVTPPSAPIEAPKPAAVMPPPAPVSAPVVAAPVPAPMPAPGPVKSAPLPVPVPAPAPKLEPVASPKSEPAPGPAPSLTALVPTTPVLAPAPKSMPAPKTVMPGVSAPAAQTKPVEAPVTEVAPQPAPKSGHASAVAAVAAPVAPSALVKGPNGKPVIVHVKKGETIETLARQYNTTAAAIMMENNLVSPTLKPGQSLKIPNHN